MKSRIKSLMLMGFSLVLLQGCVYYSEKHNPHETFKTVLYSFIGDDIDWVLKYYSKKLKWEITTLPNGNQEYRTTSRNSSLSENDEATMDFWRRIGLPVPSTLNNNNLCTKIFEVDVETHKVIRADYIGGEKNCIIGEGFERPPYIEND